MTGVPLGGSVATGFEPLREAFVANFDPTGDDPGDLGAALSVVHDGRVVADLWGGWRDLDGRSPWDADTLVNVYSVGKAVASITVLALVERGDLDLDVPLTTWWPELTAGAGSGLTLRQVLSHRAGLPAIREPLADVDLPHWSAMVGALERTEPWWEPGTAHGYHTNTLGFLLGEPVRRVRNASFGRVVAELVTDPADADFHVGLPASEHHRVAAVDVPEFDPDGMRTFLGDDPLGRMRFLAYFNPPGFSGFGTVNTPAWRSAEIPSTNPHATARAVARIFSALVGAGPPGTGRLLHRDTLAEATTPHSSGPDLVLERDSRFGLGLMLSQAGRPIGVTPASFGHYGYGGTLGFADADARIGFGYVLNRPGDRWQVPRTRRLIAALTACLS